MMREATHHARLLGADLRYEELIKQFRRLLGWSVKTQRVKVKLHMRPPPTEAPVDQQHRDRTLLDDNPCSG